ncbi:MAG: ABC transporter ATP-binding protein [Clostridia bacterium]|nr:ABC transporter ATP-binding protein [Clostridia bacterium]
MADPRKLPGQSPIRIIKNTFYMMKVVTSCVPDYPVLMLAEGMVWGFISAANAHFTYNLLNIVEAGTDFHGAAYLVGLMSLFYLVAWVFDKWYYNVRKPLIHQKLKMNMHRRLFEKSRTVDLSCFDDPEFYNDFVWTMDQSHGRAVDVMENTNYLIRSTVGSLGKLALILTIDPLVMFIIIGGAVITAVSKIIADKQAYYQSYEMSPMNRRKDYVNRVFRLSDHAKELRVGHADTVLLNDYDRNTEEMIKTNVKYGKRLFIHGVISNCLNYVIYFAVIFRMLALLQAGTVGIGGFAAAATLAFSLRWNIQDIFVWLSKYSVFSLYIERYREFLGFRSSVVSGALPVGDFESLEFRNVSFSYDFSSHPVYAYHSKAHEKKKGWEGKPDVLKNVSLKIKAGDKTALVGYNGAGKTTLIKLILRFYDPDEGAILYNGVDLRELDLEQYRKKIGVVFQDFKIFAASVAENVLFDEYDGTDEQKKLILSSLDKVDFTEKLSKLENGIDTQLTKEFADDGTELSGGEAQKIAISRVFTSPGEIMILDEPSAALDPNAEYRLNLSINESTAGKTVIFISHRLSSTRFADRIFMFDGGRLAEEGTHEELMSSGGKYAEMFKLQAQKYVSSANETSFAI